MTPELAQRGFGDGFSRLGKPNRETPRTLAGRVFPSDQKNAAVLIENQSPGCGQRILIEDCVANGAYFSESVGNHPVLDAFSALGAKDCFHSPLFVLADGVLGHDHVDM